MLSTNLQKKKTQSGSVLLNKQVFLLFNFDVLFGEINRKRFVGSKGKKGEIERS